MKGADLAKINKIYNIYLDIKKAKNIKNDKETWKVPYISMKWVLHGDEDIINFPEEFMENFMDIYLGWAAQKLKEAGIEF